MNRNWVLHLQELLFPEWGWGVAMDCVYVRKMSIIFRNANGNSKSKMARGLRFALKIL